MYIYLTFKDDLQLFNKFYKYCKISGYSIDFDIRSHIKQINKGYYYILFNFYTKSVNIIYSCLVDITKNLVFRPIFNFDYAFLISF